MLTHCKPAGNLFAYLMGPKSMSGKKREQTPVLLRGNPGLATALLELQAPACMRDLDKPRRLVRHYQRHLHHVILGFSEDQKTVESALPTAMRSTEKLVLIGLPLGSLHFVWVEHGQTLRTHAHGGVVESLLPIGGPYDLDLSPALLLLHDRLLSRKLGLSDPLDPARARLVSPSTFSCKPHNEALIRRIVDATDALWLGNGLARHDDFLKLLAAELKLEILLRPGPRGEGLLQPGAGLFHLRPYPNTVAVRNGDHLLCLKGPACRYHYAANQWRRELKDRQDAVDLFNEAPQRVNDLFRQLLQQRLERQQLLYRVLPGPDMVTLEDFEALELPLKPLVLQPESRVVETRPEVEPYRYAPEQSYPFFSGAIRQINTAPHYGAAADMREGEFELEEINWWDRDLPKPKRARQKFDTEAPTREESLPIHREESNAPLAVPGSGYAAAPSVVIDVSAEAPAETALDLTRPDDPVPKETPDQTVAAREEEGPSASRQPPIATEPHPNPLEPVASRVEPPQITLRRPLEIREAPTSPARPSLFSRTLGKASRFVTQAIRRETQSTPKPLLTVVPASPQSPTNPQAEEQQKEQEIRRRKLEALRQESLVSIGIRTAQQWADEQKSRRLIALQKTSEQERRSPAEVAAGNDTHLPGRTDKPGDNHEPPVPRQVPPEIS
jgi:hypothetical protein